jgi:hypothetical protein
MGLPCKGQETKHRAGYGAGAKISRIIVDDPELQSSYNTGLNLVAFNYEYKIKPKISLGFKLDLMFNKFLLSKGLEKETIKYSTFSLPFKISYYPIRNLPFGISSSLSATYLNQKQQINLIEPYDLRNFFSSYEGELFFDRKLNNIVLRPFINYGHSISNLISKESNQRINANYSAFSFGLIIY